MYQNVLYNESCKKINAQFEDFKKDNYIMLIMYKIFNIFIQGKGCLKSALNVHT